MKPIILDVDTQVDFMLPGGKLYVPSAEKIIPSIRGMMMFAADKGYDIISTIDTHVENDPEFATFPEHCVAGTAGFQKIPETLVYGPSFVTRVKRSDIVVNTSNKQLILEKATYDVWDEKLGNPNIHALCKDRQEIYVIGVATDICVKAAVIGLAKNTTAIVYVVMDCIRGLGNSEQALCDMITAGAKVVSMKDILRK